MDKTIRAEDFYVDPDINKAVMLPPEAYTSKEFLRMELETIFNKTWLFVPLRTADELRNDPRSLMEILQRKRARAPFSLLGEPFFLQRDEQRKLHCFPNVCTHAWFPLVEGPERKKSIVCGQHGRQFDCAGKFVSQAGFDSNLPYFPLACDNLQDITVEEWNQFFFAVLGKPVAPFQEFFKNINESLALLPVREFARRPHAHEAREVNGNWKQHAINYMDKFHINFIHAGGLSDAIEQTSYQTHLYPFSALQWVCAKNPESGFNPRFLPESFTNARNQGRRIFALWWFIFPNIAFNFYPWGLSVNVFMPVPGRHLRTMFLWYHYVFDEEKYIHVNDWWLSEDTDFEDTDAMTRLQIGAQSRFAPRGRFAPKEETGPHWFQRLVYTTMFE